MPAVLCPVNLRCEFAVNPKSVTVPQPRLHWNVDATQRGSRPMAYQILVASSSAKLRGDEGDLWDTGRINGPDLLHAQYKGKPLEPGQRVAWKVRVWDPQNRLSRWSLPALWEMADPVPAPELVPALGSSSVKLAAALTCGNPVLTPIRESITQTQIDRLITQFPDRLHSDGTMLSAEWAALAEGVMLKLDVPALLPAILQGLAQVQGDTQLAPPGSAAALGLPTVLHCAYRWFGEKRWITEHYSSISDGLAQLEDAVERDELGDEHSDLGCPGEMHVEAHGKLFASRWAALACELAQLAGDDAGARRAENLRLRINAKIQSRFSALLTKSAAADAVGLQALAVAWDIVPAAQRASLTQRVIESLSGERAVLQAGMMGTTAVLNVLADAGHADLAYRLLCHGLQSSFGATGSARSVARRNAGDGESRSSSGSSTSTLAPAAGGVEARWWVANAWIMRTLGGVQLARDAAGCDRIMIAPQPVTGLSWSKLVFDSVRGEVIISWKRRGTLLIFDVKLPCGLLAVVHVPTREMGSVAEGSRSVLVSREIRTVVPGIYRIGAGQYNFTAAAPVEVRESK